VLTTRQIEQPMPHPRRVLAPDATGPAELADERVITRCIARSRALTLAAAI
jgi:hypothetical protein